MAKKMTAPFYTETKIGLKGMFCDTKLPNGYLYAKGQYKTKITAAELPEHYVHGWIFKAIGYISVLDIKDVVYKPNYHLNHLHKDDLLYVSYDKPIIETKDELGYDIDGYDVLLNGSMVVDFIRAVRKYQSYDIEAIANEVQKKEDFFHKQSCNVNRSDLL